MVKSRFNGILLIIAGGLALAHNLGYLRCDIGQVLGVWWPAILIVVGIGFFFSSNR